MSRLDLRVSVKHHGSYAQALSILAPLGELCYWLPACLTVDGNLLDGTLTLMQDPHGKRRVSHAGSVGRQIQDQIDLPVQYLGFEYEEPLAPIDVTATCESGLVVLDAVPHGTWVPRRLAECRRAARVRDLWRDGAGARRVLKLVPEQDRPALEALREGRLCEVDAPAYVVQIHRLEVLHG